MRFLHTYHHTTSCFYSYVFNEKEGDLMNGKTISLTGRLDMLRELQQLALEGKSDEELAKHFGVQVWKIATYRNMVGVKRRNAGMNIFKGGERVVQWYVETANPIINFTLPRIEDFKLDFGQRYVVTGKKLSNRKIELSIIELGKKK